MSKWFVGVRLKLAVLILIPLLVLGGLGALGIYTNKVVNEDLDTITRDRIPLSRLLGEIKAELNNIPRFMWLAFANRENAEIRKLGLDRTQKSLARLREYSKAFFDGPLKEESRKNFESAFQDIEAIEKMYMKVKPLLELSTVEEDMRVREIMNAELLKPALDLGEWIETSEKILLAANKDVVEAARHFAERSDRIYMVSLICVVFFTLSFGGITAVRLVASLSSVSLELGHAGRETTAAATELSAASNSVSNGSSDAAAALEETVASIEELSSMVKQNADNCQQANAISQKTQVLVVKGNEDMQDLVLTMDEISQSSKSISEIINVIDDIAFQTNLLALNASVEAARAGEQGKGFAVVAEAVRSLAQRSAVAANEIKGLINASVESIQKGVTKAQQNGDNLANVVVSVQQISVITDEIAKASQEQSSGIVQISQAMNQLDQATQKNAAASEEVAATATQMAGQSQTLQDMVVTLNRVIAG